MPKNIGYGKAYKRLKGTGMSEEDIKRLDKKVGDAKPVDAAKPTSHIKDAKFGGGHNRRSPRSAGADFQKMLHGPSDFHSLQSAKKDAEAGRMTTKAKSSFKKDASRLSDKDWAKEKAKAGVKDY